MVKTASDILAAIEQEKFSKTFSLLYPANDLQRQSVRYANLMRSFAGMYEKSDYSVRLFSAPGRTEIGGNHTDHQNGRVLAAAVNLDIICAVTQTDNDIIHLKSNGHNENHVDLRNLSPVEAEENTSTSLVRGIAARMKALGYKIGGFNAYTVTDVLSGSGLSSSAAFEVAVGTILNHLYNDGKIDSVTIAQIGKYAENEYFGKPSGLMDQAAASVGGFVTFDFEDPANPVVTPVDFDFSTCGHTLCIVDTKAGHADLTDEYAAITQEMRMVAEYFGKQYLREVSEAEFFGNLPEVRDATSERAILRAMHFFADNKRVLKQVDALTSGNFSVFKKLVIESGISSFCCLQNVFSGGRLKNQELSLALAVSEKLLAHLDGAWRVHGGGFAGTIQAFVPNTSLNAYKTYMDKLFGEGACHMLSVRPFGGVEIVDS